MKHLIFVQFSSYHMIFLPSYLSLCRLFFWFHNLFVPIRGSSSDPWKILFRISAASFYFPGQMWISKSGRHHYQKGFLHLWCMEIRFPETAVFLLLITDLLILGYPFLFRILRGHFFFVFLHVFTSFYSYLNITVFSVLLSSENYVLLIEWTLCQKTKRKPPWRDFLETVMH